MSRNHIPKATLGLIFIFTSMNASSPKPSGLNNLKQTCYMNSALQVILSLNNLNNELKGMRSVYSQHSPALDYLDLLDGEDEKKIMRSSRPFCSEFLSTHTVPDENQRGKERKMTVRDPADAHEYVTWILQKLSDEDISNRALDMSVSYESWLDKQTASALNGDQEFLDTKDGKTIYPGTLQRATPLSDLYYIKYDEARFREDVELTPNRKHCFEPFPMLSFIGKNTLLECLTAYFGSEFNTKFDNYEDVETRKFVTKLPHYLFIPLKRIELDPFTGRNIKHNHEISFPLNSLILPQQPLKALIPEAVEYALAGVIVHKGTAKDGHYKAYTKYGDTWYECNDMVRVDKQNNNRCPEISTKLMQEFANKGIDKDGFLPTLFVYEKKATAAQREDNARAAEATEREKKVQLASLAKQEEQRLAEQKALEARQKEEYEAAEAQRKAAAERQEKLDVIRKAHEAEQARKAEEQKRIAAEKEAQHQTEEALVAAEDAERAEQQERVRQSLERAKEALSDARAARLKTEAARKAQEAEQARKAEEKRLVEQEEARRIEAQRVALEKAQKEREDAARIAREAEERKAEAERLAEQEAQEKKLAEEKRAAELVERKAQEEARRTEERRRAEEKMRATEEAVAKLKAQEEARKAEEQRMAESSRLAEQESQIRADGATAMELAVQEHLNQDIRIKVQREQMAADARVAARVHQEMNGGYKNPRDVQTRLAAINAAAATHKNNGGK